jgi:hypothetical protein
MEVTVLRKKLVELAKDEDKPAREEDQNSSSKKNRGKALDSEVCIWIKSKPKLSIWGFTVCPNQNVNLTREFQRFTNAVKLTFFLQFALRVSMLLFFI